MKTAVILATGPSLTPEILATAKQGQSQGLWAVYGMNHVWREFVTLDGFLACNPEYYDTQWLKGLEAIPCPKWTWDMATAGKYGLNYIRGKWGEGFSKDPDVIHYGHSSGFQLPQIAVHAGFKRLLLCGYDMTYAKDYDGRNRRTGSTPRHFFGEYDHPELNHWPSNRIENGVFVDLIKQFERVKTLNPDIEIINCSPNSAMLCFPFGQLGDFLHDSDSVLT